MRAQFFLSLLNYQLYFGFFSCYLAIEYQIADEFDLPDGSLSTFVLS